MTYCLIADKEGEKLPLPEKALAEGETLKKSMWGFHRRHKKKIGSTRWAIFELYLVETQSNGVILEDLDTLDQFETREPLRSSLLVGKKFKFVMFHHDTQNVFSQLQILCPNFCSLLDQRENGKFHLKQRDWLVSICLK